MTLLWAEARDDGVAAFAGYALASERQRDVHYELRRLLGSGAMSHAYLAERVGAEGRSVVVVKLLRPSIVREHGESALLVARKEAVALGRLNERVPPTPFVVRLLDAGSVRLLFGGNELDVPWLALEHVAGGPEGTTLAERVARSVQGTGAAFDGDRAAHAIECVAAGLDAIHELGIIHRDVKPDNILCCGFAESELFKVADFGVARPAGLAQTFGAAVLGTPGYAPPELFGLVSSPTSEASDVFSFAAVVYHLLTGDEYFDAPTVGAALRCMRDPARKSLLGAPTLSGDLRERPLACKALDAVLRRATTVEPALRPRSAGALAAELLPSLRPESRRLRASLKRRTSVLALCEGLEDTSLFGWSWRVLCAPQAVSVRDVGWDGDGCCLAATDRGLAFWDGAMWRSVREPSLPSPAARTGDARLAPTGALGPIRFVRRIAPGKWIVGGEHATLASYGHEGLRQVLRGHDERVTFDHLSGEPDDFLVVAESAAGEAPRLRATLGKRWFRPAALEDAVAVTALARVADEGWLVAASQKSGKSLLALYEPLEWSFSPLTEPLPDPVTAAAGRDELGLGIAVGARGTAFWVEGGRARPEPVPGAPDLTAATIDALGRAWVAGRGEVRQRVAGVDGAARWRGLGAHGGTAAPIVSLHADIESITAVAADGTVIEGRLG